jgi:hypothetical protein
VRDLEGIAEINGPRRAELQAERVANAERARLKNLDWRARVAEAERNLRRRAVGPGNERQRAEQPPPAKSAPVRWLDGGGKEQS